MLTGQVWIGVVICVMVWRMILWTLEKLRHWMLGGRHLSLSSSVFYGWGILLEDIPYDPPTNLTGQVIMRISLYKSRYIALLTIN